MIGKDLSTNLGTGVSPLLTVEEACIYLRIVQADGTPDVPRFYEWKRRHKPKCYRLGANARLLRFRREDLDATLTVENEPVKVSLRGFPVRRS
jgi:hypothetical protein